MKLAAGDARNAATGPISSGSPIRLVDREDFVALWIRHHDALPDAARDMMRLKAVHFLERRTGPANAASSRPSAQRESRDPSIPRFRLYEFCGIVDPGSAFGRPA